MRNSSRNATHHRGLTLIELLVAISVLGVVAVLGWRGLDSIVRARLALNADLEQTRGMQLTFAQLQNDCTHLADASMLGSRPPILAEQDRLSLIRTVFADDQPTRLEVVTYRLENGTLTRRESVPTRDLAAVDAEWQSASGDSGADTPVVLQSGVDSMTMRLWSSGSNGWISGADALQQAGQSSTASALSITGLEVTLQMHDQHSSLKKIFLLGAV